MPKLLFDAKIFDLQKTSKLKKGDGDAIKLLGYIASLMRSGDELPPHAIDYLASALEAASAEHNGRDAMRALAEALHLVVPHCRPSSDWYDVGYAVEMLLLGGSKARLVPDGSGGLRVQFFEDKDSPGRSLTNATEEIAGLFEIDAKTARRYHQIYTEHKELHDSIE